MLKQLTIEIHKSELDILAGSLPEDRSIDRQHHIEALRINGGSHVAYATRQEPSTLDYGSSVVP